MAESKINPIEVSDVEMAFPATVDHLLPSWDEIPDEFKGNNNVFVKITNDQFFGIKNDSSLSLKPDFDLSLVQRHLHCCMGSFSPRHEHKIAGVAYLLSQWFDIVSPEEVANEN